MQNYFDRDLTCSFPLKERAHLVDIREARISLLNHHVGLNDGAEAVIKQTALDIIEAKNRASSRILTFGTHLIQNGLGPLLVEFVDRGWLTHLAATGTALVEDWEFAHLGKSCEDAKENLPLGRFGMWQETGHFINLAILVGAYEGKGLGESIASMIAKEGLMIPDRSLLHEVIKNENDDEDRQASAADLLDKLKRYHIEGGWINVPAPFREYSLLYGAHCNEIPFTVHPQFGLDVFYTNPINSIAAVGRCAERDFLSFVSSVNMLEDGIYLSVGSSVASPMIFEKALSMSQNVRIPNGMRMEKHKIVVVDLAESNWDWMASGEPPEERPEYYQRFNKSFSRAKAKSMHYVAADNRDFFVALYKALDAFDKQI